MKTIQIIALMILCVGSSMANPVFIGDTKVTFIPPAEFKKLPQRIIDLKWPNNRAPKYVVGNETASTTVAYDLKPNNIPQEHLAEIQKTFTDIFNRAVPGIQWKKNEIITHSGQKWIFLEMTSNAIDTDIHNIMMLTGYNGKMLIFNFNSTKEDFVKYEEQLRVSLKSIKLPK